MAANSNKTPASWWKTKTAGKQWYYDYMRHHNKVSLRMQHTTSLSWVTTFKRYIVPGFVLICLGFFKDTSLLHIKYTIWMMKQPVHLYTLQTKLLLAKALNK
jgi:hypothetical protein